MKRVLQIIGIVFLSIEFLSAQTSHIDVKSLPKPDCDGRFWNEFNSQENKLLVLPDSPSDSLFLMLKKQVVQGWNNESIKLESQLSEEDYKKPLYIYGLIHEFKNWEKLNSPILRTDKGFNFKGVDYDDWLDGITFISPTRMIVVGNSCRILQILQSTMTYKYLIIKNGVIFQNAYSDSIVINLDSIRKNSYFQTHTKYFDVFTSKQFEAVEINYDSIVNKICYDLSLVMPKETIKCYFHQTGDEFLLFSGLYFMTGCNDWNMGNNFGMTESMAIHCVSSEKFLNHEAFHKIWELCIGKLSNSFFIEGIQEYYSYLENTASFNKSVEIVKKHTDFGIKKLIVEGNGNDFWGGPSENDWPVAYNFSGCFVKYLIDNWGLNNFKCVYVMEDKEKAFEIYYDKSISDLIDSFYNWINNISGS
jgi:hypothetical protein